MSAELVFSAARALDGALVFGADVDGPTSPVEPAAGPADLVFSAPWTGSAKLVFGESDGPVGPVLGATVDIIASLPGLHVSGVVRIGVRVSAVASMPGMYCAAAVVYDTRTARPTVSAATSTWQQARKAQAGTESRYQRSESQSSGARARWQKSQPLQRGLRNTWQQSLQLARLARTAYQQAAPLPIAPVGTAWQASERLRTSAAARFQQAQRLPTAPARQSFQEAQHLRAGGSQHWQQAARTQTSVRHWAGYGLPVRIDMGTRFQQAWPPRPGITPSRPTGPGTKDPCYVPPNGLHVELVFSDPWSPLADLVFVCGRHGGPEPGATITIPVRRYYVTINDIVLRRVDGNIELLAYAFNMSIDADSWTWSFSATLRKDALPFLEPGSRTDPVELEAVINGVPYRLQVEKIGRDTQFGSVRIRVSGRGLASILAAPYAPTLNFGNTAPRTAQQLMADVLTVNGVPIGWDVDWGLTDWLVPAGAWAKQGSYMDAVNDIAGAAGGYVQPHATAQTLRILPRYPVAPWEWGTVTPDIELPAAAASVESIEWLDRPAYNGVFVGGVSHGVFGPFKRAGTAGELLAPQVTHALITHAAAHRQRGIAELANTGRQAHFEIKTMVYAETGLILPGQFVRYVGDSSVIGIVRSTSLDWSRPLMHQTIGVETHVLA